MKSILVLNSLEYSIAPFLKTLFLLLSGHFGGGGGEDSFSLEYMQNKCESNTTILVPRPMSDRVARGLLIAVAYQTYGLFFCFVLFNFIFLFQVSESGVHRPHVAGIHGRSNDGAYSLVLAGGYEDDIVSGSLLFMSENQTNLRLWL